MRNKAFTIIEFTISMTIMFLVIASCVPIIFKKAVISERIQKKDNLIVCSCRQESIVVNDGNYLYCDIEMETRASDEFFTVQLIGGGAGGGNNFGGRAGELKVLYLPSMPGKYRLVLGQGGQSGQSGGNTAIYHEFSEGSYRLLAYARGGVFPGNLPSSDPTNTEQVEQEKLGELPNSTESLEESGAGVCGKGGDNTQAGNPGEVIIRW